MSLIGRNIRKLRTVKKLSQAAFAELFNLGRASVGAYEEGRAEPKIETVIGMSRYFKISIDDLLMKELTINDIYNYDPLKKKRFSVRHSEIPFIEKGKLEDFLQKGHLKNYTEMLPAIVLPFGVPLPARAFEVAKDLQEFGIRTNDIIIGTNQKQQIGINISSNGIELSENLQSQWYVWKIITSVSRTFSENQRIDLLEKKFEYLEKEIHILRKDA